MITKEQFNFKQYKQTHKVVKPGILNQVLVNVMRSLFSGEVSLMLDYYERMLNFLKLVGLLAYARNKNISLNIGNNLITDSENFDEKLRLSFVEFLFQYEILVRQKQGLQMNPEYKKLFSSAALHEIVHKKQRPDYHGFTKKELILINDFLFITDLINRYRNTNHKFEHIKKHANKWSALLENKKLDYEVRLSETLYNLIHLKIPEKIVSPFSEDYYTESGQNAFKNFTQYVFIDYLKEITKTNTSPRVLDLGCGYGNYIDIIRKSFKESEITGVEKNKTVSQATKEKFRSAKKITIVNADFFGISSEEKYDLILMNYVLFYFSYAEKQKVLAKAKSMLKEDGSIVLCQYIAGIEDLKTKLARHHSDNTLAQKTEQYYSNKVLYANTLWNDSVDTFSEAVKWKDLTSILEKEKLEINSITNADKFYYSLFIELKRLSE